MGKRGPAPAPTQLKLVQGITRKARINLDEPQAREGLPECPDGASAEVRAIWNYTVDQLDHMKVLTMADRDTLYAYCEAVATHRQACRIVARDGLIVEGQMGGPAKHPIAQVVRDQATLIRGLAQEFGLTPSARSTIKMNVADAKTPAGAARLLS